MCGLNHKSVGVFLYSIIKILSVYLVSKDFYIDITVITENVYPFLKCIKSVRMDGNLFIENYGKVRVAYTFGNTDFIIKCNKSSYEGGFPYICKKL